MNCRKDDIAMYVGHAEQLAHLRGRLFLCVEWMVDSEGTAGWRTDPPPHPLGEGFQDHVLRPIRDPGPGAVDETLVWAGTPCEVTA